MADETTKPPQWTRYQRVKAILNEASGDASPSYQGYGKFWELPLAQLLEVVIYGVRIIAPGAGPSVQAPIFALAPAAPSCCHAPAAGAGDTPSDAGKMPGRGARSGLIIGLRGQSPFDGAQFSPLPWGGQPVASADIQFIEDWIDDGCPESDASRSAVEVHESALKARARGDEEYPLSSAPSNDYRNDQGSVKTRKNINALTPAELNRFRAAVACMKSLDNYYQDERSFAYWARMHGNQCQHGWEEFLTWHRLYLYFFELHLQDNDPSVTLPYWDWTDNTTPNIGSSLFDAARQDPSIKTDNGVIPEAYRCFLTQAGWDALKAHGAVSPEVLDKLLKVVQSGISYNSGLRLFGAANINYGENKASDDAIMATLALVNPLWHRLRWPGGDQGLIFEAYPTPDDIQRILALPSFFNFGSGPMNNHFFGAVENIHNLIHNFSGGANPNYKMGSNPSDRNNEPQFGDMVNAGVTAFDPIFWGHHSNVDRLWFEWSKLHSGAGPDDGSAVLPPFSLTVQDTLDIANFGYEYVKFEQLYPVSSELAVSNFKSAKTAVPQNVLNDHSSAEVRLHKVHYRTRGGFHVRVFLNSPGADDKTPTRGNDHYVGQFSMFNGFCIGGPGHCDPPPEARRKFDRRPRAHKTPGNVRLDASDSVRKLAAQGATAFQVNLVVLNTDGTPANDALLMRAVTLIFKE
ncbi:MAG: tyrosinase family protein [Candidatus Korobacteraceae bacterium]